MEPIDGSWLALYRIGLGASLLWQVWKFFSTDLIRSFYIEPTHHLTWYGFDFVRPWPEAGMYLHFSVMAVAASCIIVGFHYRLASFVYSLGMTWLFLIDQCWYLNHYYLICLLSFVAVFLPANRQWSIDCRLNPQLRSCQVPRWSLWLMRFQLGVPYFFAGIAKMNPDWIAGEPLRVWMADSTDFPLIGQYFTSEWCVQLFCWGGLLLDLFVVPLLLWRRTRPLTLVIVICFHLANARMFQIGVFPWMMIWATTTVFLPPETIARLLRRPPAGPDDALRYASVRNRLHPLAGGVLLVYLTWQVAMPMRHWFYPGHTAFTREGHQFAWRMKLNRRTLDLQFRFTDPATGQDYRLPVSHWLTSLQEEDVRDADHILQLARWMEHDVRESGILNPMITVHAQVSLNGRPFIPFVDPELDLTKQPRSWWPADWITQQPDPLYLPARAPEEADE